MAAAVLLDIIFRRKMRTRSPRAQPAFGRIHLVKNKSTTERHSTKCRICLKDGQIPIFEQENIADDIRKFGEIELNAEDNLPQTVCHECYGMLQAAVLFHKMAQDSDRILRRPGARSGSNTSTTEQKPPADCSDDGGVNDPGADWDDADKDDDNKYRCKRCQVDFATAEEFLEHRKSEAHLKPRVQCPECMVTVNKGSLKAHVTRLHTTVQPYICDVCGKSFAMKGSFKRHLMIHTDELPFKCQRCPYRCRYRASLKEHERVHTGERPYACAHCPASFPNASNFRKHSRTHQAHTQYKCEHCHKGFHTMHKMKAHIKVDHMGLKEHVCDVCGKEFGYKEKLGQHMKNVHKRPRRRSGRLPLYLQIDEKLDRRRGLAQAHGDPA